MHYFFPEMQNFFLNTNQKLFGGFPGVYQSNFIGAISTSVPMLWELYGPFILRNRKYLYGYERFSQTYLIKQCNPLLFMNLFCWEWNKSSLFRKRVWTTYEAVEMKREPSQASECSLNASDLCTSRIFIDDSMGWRESLEKRETKLKSEI